MSDPATSTVERLGVEPIPSRERRPRPPLHAVEPPAPPATVYVPQKPSAAEMILANLKAISLILSARALLLLSLIGAFVLALGAMSWQSPMGLYVLVAWCVGTIGPMAWLEVTGRRRPPG